MSALTKTTPRLAAGLLVGAGLLLTGVLGVPTAAVAATTSAARGPGDGTTLRGRPGQGGRLVTAENDRIYNVRALASAARWSGLAVSQPYRLATGSSYTLVLVARGAAYTVDDLARLAPSTFVKQPDGSWLLSENIVVENGATLRLASPDGLRIHLASNHEASCRSSPRPAACRSSVRRRLRSRSTPGTRRQGGSTSRPRTDGRTSGCRAGPRPCSTRRFSHLGFWSGTTGGVSLTGTNLSTLDQASGDQQGKTERTTKDVFATPSCRPRAAEERSGSATASAGGYSYVSALVQHVTFAGNAYGLFLTSADGVTMSDATVEHSLIDGLVLHRYVTNSTFTSVRSTDNAVDGVKMTRASTGIVLSQVTALGQRSQRDHAERQRARGGAERGRHADDDLRQQRALGQQQLRQRALRHRGDRREERPDQRSTVARNEMGIVVRHDADDVVVRNNVVKDSSQNGIAVLDGPSRTEVSENSVDGADIGVYVRDSATSSVTNNAIDDARVHGSRWSGRWVARPSRTTRWTVAGRARSTSPVRRSRPAGQHDRRVAVDETVPRHPARGVPTVDGAVAPATDGGAGRGDRRDTTSTSGTARAAVREAGTAVQLHPRRGGPGLARSPARGGPRHARCRAGCGRTLGELTGDATTPSPAVTPRRRRSGLGGRSAGGRRCVGRHERCGPGGRAGRSPPADAERRADPGRDAERCPGHPCDARRDRDWIARRRDGTGLPGRHGPGATPPRRRRSARRRPWRRHSTTLEQGRDPARVRHVHRPVRGLRGRDVGRTRDAVRPA